MAKRYVDMDQLEKLFAEYAVPYTNIFDGLTQVAAEDIVSDMPLIDLTVAMRGRSDVVAMQVWSRNDIHAAIQNARMKPGAGIVPSGSNFIDRVSAKAAPMLNDCTGNWDKVHEAIRECMKEDKE